MSTETEWIGVAAVAAELGLSDRAAWELLRRAGLKMLNPRSRTLARFRRSDWEEAREASMAPVPPRAAYAKGRGATPPAATPRAPAGDAKAKLAKLRKA